MTNKDALSTQIKSGMVVISIELSTAHMFVYTACFFAADIALVPVVEHLAEGSCS